MNSISTSDNNDHLLHWIGAMRSFSQDPTAIPMFKKLLSASLGNQKRLLNSGSRPFCSSPRIAAMDVSGTGRTPMKALTI